MQASTLVLPRRREAQKRSGTHLGRNLRASPARLKAFVRSSLPSLRTLLSSFPGFSHLAPVLLSLAYSPGAGGAGWPGVGRHVGERSFGPVLASASGRLELPNPLPAAADGPSQGGPGGRCFSARRGWPCQPRLRPGARLRRRGTSRGPRCPGLCPRLGVPLVLLALALLTRMLLSLWTWRSATLSP